MTGGGRWEAELGAATLAAMMLALAWTGRLLFVPRMHYGEGRYPWWVIGLALIAAVATWRVVHRLQKNGHIATAAAAVPLLGIGTLLLPVWHNPAGWVLVTIAAYALLCELAAHQWSRRSLRIVVALGVAASLALVVKVGRQEVDERRLSGARNAVPVLDERLVAADSAATGQVEASKAKSAAAVGEARRVIGAAVGDVVPGSTIPTGCAAAGARSIDGELCSTLGKLQNLMADVAEVAAEGTGKQAEELGATIEAIRQRTAAGDVARERIERTALASAAVSSYLAASQARKGLDAAAVREALRALCKDAAGNLPDDTMTGLSCSKGSSTGIGFRSLAVSRAKAERSVAAFVAQVSRSDADKAAAAKADANLARARTEEEDPPPSMALQSVLATGGGRLVQAMPGLDGNRGSIALALVGWLALATLALVGYRRLEILNSSHGLSTVTIGKLAGGGTDQPELEAAFRRHVIANVPEPGAVPGSRSVVSVTDLLEAGGNPASKILASILKVLRGLTAASAGYSVDATYSKLAQGVGGRQEEHELFVRVLDARTGGTEVTRTFRDTDTRVVLRSGGYWAASWVLGQDRTAPSWAGWTGDSAEALAACDEAMDARGVPAVDAMRKAVRGAPTSGVLLVRLANALSLQGEHLEALELHVRAATVHPRYAVARYRLSTSLSVVAADAESRWCKLTISHRRQIVGALTRCAVACMVYPIPALQHLGDDIEAPTADASRRRLCLVAEAFVDGARDLFDGRCVRNNAFRRSERRYWAPMLYNSKARANRTRFQETVDSARYAIRARGEQAVPSGVDAAEARAQTGSPWWQVLYNFACYYGVRAATTGSQTDRQAAVSLLEQVLEQDGAGQLMRDWVDRDPDLAALAHDERFQEFRERLARREPQDQGMSQ